MTDFRRFLGAQTREVAAYFGGDYVEARSRRLRRRDAAEPDPGWWTVEVSGRTAVPLAPATAPDLSDLPLARGHYAPPYLMGARGQAERLEVMGAEEPARFAPILARRWTSGDLILDATDFETEVEEDARAAFEDGRSTQSIKGVPSTLRAAFGYALIARAAAAMGTHVAPAEVAASLGPVAEGGPDAAREAVAGVVRARRNEPTLVRARGAATGAAAVGGESRAEAALRAAGASLRGLRTLDGGLLEVRFRFEGERFVAVVEADGLGVVDAGICLQGRDRMITLESLPSVIREAMVTSSLHITRAG